LGKVSIQVFPGKGKEEIGVWMEGDSKKGVLEVENRKMRSTRRDVGEDGIRIWDQRVDGDNSLIYNAQILD
jgi:tRNA U54 and U55 pseudouridine synthase Pus10